MKTPPTETKKLMVDKERIDSILRRMAASQPLPVCAFPLESFPYTALPRPYESHMLEEIVWETVKQFFLFEAPRLIRF